MPIDNYVGPCSICGTDIYADQGHTCGSKGLPTKIKDITAHSGNKYVRQITTCTGLAATFPVDVYAVLKAFDVRCPARQHAIKKLLCAGFRGKGSQVQDIKEAIDALYRAVQLQEQEETNK